MRKRTGKAHILYASALLLIILTAYVISNFLWQFALINGGSMLPTYKEAEFVIIDKTVRNFQRGDVVAFECKGLDSDLVKRIVALPGDTVKIDNGILSVNGEPSEYVHSTLTYPGIASDRLCLSEDEYFVIGDNADESRDSRDPEVGLIKKSDILGKIIPQKH
ncbi:MAG: signal peptidase I [Clostridia bacterium]|nr:signal peptidase I [Clostridia bacterium]